MQSDLNFYLEGEGEQFDQDKLNLFTSLVMENSTIRGLQIDSTRAIVDIRNEKDRRVINVISDLADITLSGNFNISELIDVLNYKSNMFSSAVNEKINNIQYPASSKIFNDNTSLASLNPDIDLYYALEFKDFELLSLFLGNAEIEIDGELTGKINTYPDSIYVSLNTNLDYFKFWDGNELIYLSQLDLEFLFSDILSATDLTSVITDIKLKARKIFLGSDFDNLMLNFEYKNHSAIVDFYVVIGELFKTKLNGELDIRGEKASFTMDKLFLSYNKFNLINKGKLDIVYSNQDITFNRFVLTHNNGEMNLLR